MVKKTKYVLAFLVALNALILIFMTINYVDNQRIISFNNDIALFMLEATDMQQTFDSFEESPRPEFCAMVKRAFTQKLKRNDEMAEKMVAYEQANLIKEFRIIKREYLLANLQLYRLSRLQKEYCESTHSDIMFIYSSDPGAYDSVIAGQVLTEARQGCDARVFVTDLEEADSLVSIGALVERYKIDKAPAFIIDDEHIEGILSKEQIKEKIGCE